MDRSPEDCAETRRKPLPAFEDNAPRDRYCDLILSGGVTSAIAYPPAIFALASAYRLRSVGGTSSGAGSAALAAAAEYRRRNGSPDGFRLLLERTAEVAETFDDKTGLQWLFQPGPKKQRLFRLLVNAVAPPRDKLRRFLCSLFLSYFVLPLLLAAVLIFALFTVDLPEPRLLCAAVRAILAIGCLAAAVWLAGRLLWLDVRVVLDDGYGLCSGNEPLPGAPRAPLTPWLHGLIQELAGLPEHTPLTFADLEAAPGAPSETLHVGAPKDHASIKLQVFTANLTTGRPELFPLTDDPGDDDALYFLASDMRRLFPGSVVDHLVKVSTPYAGLALPEDPVHRYAGRDKVKDPFLRLPGKQLPILVATRMSLSFPVLFEAVPLWAVHRRPVDGKRGTPQEMKETLRRCLFADGGLCSGFPIHLFDSAVPNWPTFGIALRDLLPPKGEQTVCKQRESMIDSIHLPARHDEQIEDVWSSFDEKPNRGARLGEFLGATLSTIIGWNDATLARLPGVRDRVVRVGLSEGIGGLNILMSDKQIRVLAEVGSKAAIRLLDRFAKPDGPDALAAGWREHRWVRFNILRDCLSETLSGFGASAASRKFTQPLAEHIDDATAAPPLATAEPPRKGERPASQLLASQAAALQGVLAALQEAEQALSASVAEQPYQPYPRPDLRIRPPL